MCSHIGQFHPYTYHQIDKVASRTHQNLSRKKIKRISTLQTFLLITRTRMICFPIHRQPWYAFLTKEWYVFRLILLAYSIKHIIRLQIRGIKNHCVLEMICFSLWPRFWYVIYNRPLKKTSISIFCPKAHQCWLPKKKKTKQNRKKNQTNKNKHTILFYTVRLTSPCQGRSST